MKRHEIVTLPERRGAVTPDLASGWLAVIHTTRHIGNCSLSREPSCVIPPRCRSRIDADSSWLGDMCGCSRSGTS